MNCPSDKRARPVFLSHLMRRLSNDRSKDKYHDNKSTEEFQSSSTTSFRSIRIQFNDFMSSEIESTIETSALPPADPSTHNVTRREIIYLIQLYITAGLRQTFLREEIDKAELAHMQKMNNDSTSSDIDNQFIPDMIQINKDANRKIKSYRSFIKKQSFFYDNILYKRAMIMEEYYNIEDLENRLDEVGRILNRRIMRVHEAR